MVCCHVAVAIVAAVAVAVAVVVVAAAAAAVELVPTSEDVRFPKRLNTVISRVGNPSVFLCKVEP